MEGKVLTREKLKSIFIIKVGENNYFVFSMKTKKDLKYKCEGIDVGKKLLQSSLDKSSNGYSAAIKESSKKNYGKIQNEIGGPYRFGCI